MLGAWSVATLLVGSLGGLYRYERNRCRRARGALFSRSLDLFDTYRVTQDHMAYPVLVGTYRGVAVRLEPIVDDLTWRKLPSLWLKTTVLTPTACRGVCDLLIRPRGCEFYSPSADLENHLPLPPDWPRDALLCTDDPAGKPPLGILNEHIGLFDDPQMKELVITPHGVRLVRQIWQAERGPYLVLRQVQFEQEQIEREVLARLLDAAMAIAHDLSSSGAVARAA